MNDKERLFSDRVSVICFFGVLLCLCLMALCGRAHAQQTQVGTDPVSIGGVTYQAPRVPFIGLRSLDMEGTVYANEQPGTSWDQQVSNCLNALIAPGGVCDATNMTNLTMTGNLVFSRSNATLKVGQYSVLMGSNNISAPGGTQNIAILGCCTTGLDIGGTQKGSVFVYTGTGSAISLGAAGTQSLNHRVEDITVDITGAGTSAVGIDSTLVYHTFLLRPRVVGKISASSQILVRNNGTNAAPGSQNFLMIQPYLSNGNIAYQCIGTNSPPTCNMNQWIGGEATGPGAGVVGSIGADIENGNNNAFYGAVITNYETALKSNSTSNMSVLGDFHAESVTNCINFTASTANNSIRTDCGNTIIDAGTLNSIDDPSKTNPHVFSGHVVVRGNTSLPAATSGGAGGFIAAGFASPSAIRFYCGDGTGFQCEFAKRTGSADTVLAKIPDSISGGPFSLTLTIGSGTSTSNGTAIAAGTTQAQPTIAITGAAATDTAKCNLNAAPPATWQTGIVLSWNVTANTVTPELTNPTAASITPVATAVRCAVTR